MKWTNRWIGICRSIANPGTLSITRSSRSLFSTSPKCQAPLPINSTSKKSDAINILPQRFCFAVMIVLSLMTNSLARAGGNCPSCKVEGGVWASTQTAAVYFSTAAPNALYAYGFGAGQEYERQHDLDTIDNWRLHCSDSAFWPVTNSLDASTCLFLLQDLRNYIYEQNLSSPTVVSPVVP